MPDNEHVDPAAADFEFKISCDEVIITKYTGFNTDVIIPGMIDDMPVVCIDDNAFEWCVTLQKVVIPLGVMRIGNDAFSACVNLSEVALPSSVISIECGAFSQCINLVDIGIPSGVVDVDPFAFAHCPRLKAINVDVLNPAFSSRDGVLFNKEQSKLLFCPAGKTGIYAIPEGVISIAWEALSWCNRLAELIFPKSLAEIDDEVFPACYSPMIITVNPCNPVYCSVNGVLFSKDMSSIIRYPMNETSDYVIPRGVTAIKDRAFNHTNLANISIPETLVVISPWSFSNCERLMAISVDNDNPLLSSSNGVLFDKQKTKILKCPKGILGSFVIPDSVRNISDSTFSGCNKLSHIQIPEGVTNIGADAFGSCGALVDVVIPSTVTHIGDQSFRYCENLIKITFPSSVAFIGREVFYGCISLLDVTFDCAADDIGDDLFCRCELLKNIRVGPSAKKLNGATFGLCSSLSSITVDPGNSLYCSEEGVMFSKHRTWLIRCPDKRSVDFVMPAGVSVIGPYAFWGCSGLVSLDIPDSVVSIGEHGFDGCENITDVSIGAGVKRIDAFVFKGCSNLKTISVLGGVTFIGDDAFDDCPSLEGIYFHGNAPQTSNWIFPLSSKVTIYYKAGTTGWSDTFCGKPTEMWTI